MAEPKQPDDPTVIAGKYALAAKDTVTRAAKVATDAFDKINAETVNGVPPPRYDTRDAINTLAQFANVALTGTISLARVALQTQPSRGALIVADNVASIVNRGLSDALGVAAELAGEANSAINATPMIYDSDDLVDAAIKLTNIGALRTAEIVETLVAGPGAYGDPVVRRTLPIVAKPYERILEVGSLKLTGSPDDIKLLVSFDPPSGELPADRDEYTIVVNMAGLPSGLYSGNVLGWPAVPVDPAKPNGAKVPDTTTVPTSDAVLVALPETDDPATP